MTRHVPLLLAAAAALLQSPALLGQAQQTPGVTFQVEVNYVDVDVVVTDEQGNFVTGLTREDFEVFEDGKPQKVDTFSLVRTARREADGVCRRRSARSRPIRRPTASPSTDGCMPSCSTISTSAPCAARRCAMRHVSSCSGTWVPTIWAPSSTRAAARRGAGIHNQS